MFQLAHASLLLVHLLKSFVFSKLLKQFNLEVFFQSFLFSCTLCLQPHLEVFCFLQLHLGTLSLFELCFLSGSCSKLSLLEVEFVSQILLKFFLRASLHFLRFQAFENLISCLLSRVFSRLDLVEPLLLLFRILAHHFILKCFHFLLPLEQGSFLVD